MQYVAVPTAPNVETPDAGWSRRLHDSAQWCSATWENQGPGTVAVAVVVDGALGILLEKSRPSIKERISERPALARRRLRRRQRSRLRMARRCSAICRVFSSAPPPLRSSAAAMLL